MQNTFTTFKTIIDTNHWLSVEAVLISLYPDQIDAIDLYSKVFDKLRVLQPQETDITLFIQQDMDEEIGQLTFPDVYGKCPTEKFGLALEFMEWRKWLGLTISNETWETYNELEIIAHCLYEMTFVDYDEEMIQAEMHKINSIADDYKSLSKEEKKTQTISIEELTKKLNSKSNNP